MLFKIVFLTCLFFPNVLIQLSTCALPGNIQNLELDDITSIWDKFPSFIDKIKEAVSRFRCPKGWKRLGGSCFYLSNRTSTSIHANHSCHLLHSNLSHLMQIRNAVDLLYAAHLLTRNNLSALIIDIHPNLLKGRAISDMLMNDQGRWGRMKKQFGEVRIRYQRLKEKIVDRLTSTGLRILRRTKKVKDISHQQRVSGGDDETDPSQYDEYDFDERATTMSDSNNTATNRSVVTNVDDDEYEYDDLDSPDESDAFEEIDDIRGICDQLDWNVVHDHHHHDGDHNRSVYVLTTYIVSEKMVCSLSDVESDDVAYRHVCEYVLDYCFANIICGEHGQCMNTMAGVKCSCSFLYGGLLCEKISEHGQQIIISLVIIAILVLLSLKPIRWLLWSIIKLIIRCCKKRRKSREQKKSGTGNDREQLVKTDKSDNNGDISMTSALASRRPTLAQEFIEFLQEIYRCITLPKTPNPLLNPIKRNLVRSIWIGMLTIVFLSILFISTTIMYLLSFGYTINDDRDEEFSINDTIRLVTQCEYISDYRRGNIIFAPFALSLILIFSWSLKREKHCLDMCDGRPALIPPIEPFRTGNRFTTATVFGILAFEVLKIFEELLFSTGQPLHQGVLIELLERIALVILVGLRYYPVLASLQLQNIVARSFICLYIICDVIYTIIREGSCMGFLPLSGHYTALEEAKLRKELGTWFIVYGLIKNIPHFFLLSYIAAELCVRFFYDTMYVLRKKKKSIWSSPVMQLDESEFSKYYVTKLFRRNRNYIRTSSSRNINTNPDNLIDHEHEAKLQDQLNQSRVKRFFDYIYHSDDDFRFTTIATCTYTVAIVFLYYLSCTFVFLYLSRTTGHISFLKFYIESTFNVELGAFSLKLEVILSALFTVIIYGFQLFIGMQNYKKHKLQLYKGIYVDVPSAINFKPSSMASNSVHYSGFLVGYMAWGFVICFHLILLIFIGLRIISLQIRHIELILAIVVPVLVIYFLKMLSMRSAGKFLFIQQLDDKLNLKSRKTYALFVYFSFFADCFLGIASCIIRLIKATFLNVVFMARLDWSFLGRPLEKFDLGFAAYISYLHMEVTYTNPVMLAFCYSLYEDIVQRRPRQCYDDECCIAPGELDDDDDDEIETPRRNQEQANRTNLTPNSPVVRYSRRNKDSKSTQDNNNSSVDEVVSKKTSRKETKQHDQDLSTMKITSEIESLRPSTIITTKAQKQTDRKMKQQETHMVAEGEQSNRSTVTRLKQQQKPSVNFAPEVPRREDRTSEHDESETDDDAVKQRSFSTITEIIPQQPPRLISAPKTSRRPRDTPEDTDEDDSGSKNKRLAAKKNKQATEEKQKNIQKQTARSDAGDDVSKRQKSNTKLDNRRSKNKSSSDNTDDGAQQSSRHQKNTISTSYETIDRMVIPIADTIASSKPRKTTGKYLPNTTSTTNRHDTEETTSYCPPSYNLTTNLADLCHLRTISYREAHQSTLPLIPRRSNVPSTLQSRKHTIDNDDSSHYSEVTHDTHRSTVGNRAYSKTGLIQVSSDHSNKQRSFKDQTQNEYTDVETDEEEEKEENQEAVQLLQSRTNGGINNLTTIITSTTSEKDDEDKKRIRQRKRLRFRWHLLYTIIRNYHLFDLRKDVQGRLTRLHLQRSNLIDEQQLSPTTTVIQPRAVTFAADSSQITMQAQGPDTPFMPDMPTITERRPPSVHRLLSVPVPVVNEYPPSPAERYIAIRAQMLYDANTQLPNASYNSTTSQAATTAISSNQQRRHPMLSGLSAQSLGFPMSPNITVQPPSESSAASRQRQTSDRRTPRIVSTENMTPLSFQPASGSNLSTADYPLATASIANSSTLRTQMSHDQHMQVWRQDQMGKIQRKRRHCYVYGPPPQTPLADKVSTAAILTPQILQTATRQQQVPPTPNDGEIQRQPTTSPFQFPNARSQVERRPPPIMSDTQPKNDNQKLKIYRQQQEIPLPPPRMDRLDEDPLEISTTNRSSKTTAVLIHQEDSQSDSSDTT